MTPAGPPPPLARLPDEWATEMRALGGRPFHGRQIFRWIHARGVVDVAKMTDLPASVRATLSSLELERVADVASVHRAADGTRKLVARMKDDMAVETVLIPRVASHRGELPSPLDEDADVAANDDDDDSVNAQQQDGVVRVTQCISTQVGCAMGCVFCASGVAGIKRNLGPDEIVAQLILGKAHLEAGEELRNVVFMGMGEPLHNYDATVRALRLMVHPEGLGLSSRRITVSTSGLVPEIARLGADFQGHIGLAVSLHAADDETRSRLMPINRKYPLAKLMEALRSYPLPRRRRITIEYTLVSGKNDSTSEASKLATLLRGLPVKVNVIPMNPIDASALGPPEMGRVFEFQRVLVDAGYSCFIRRRRGDDVAAACGQLALRGAKPRVRVLRS
jgi:23S rRNA (adenine2503-C2)-methyltransferase